jgi:predicted transcriptional regulator
VIKLSTRITTQVRFKKSLDLKMKEIATKEGKTKEKVYEEAILEFLKNQSQEQVIQDGKIEELLNAKLGNIDKHLSSMIGQLSKDLALVYGTSIYNLQKTLDLLGLDTKQKYTDKEIMNIMESRGDAIHAHLMIRARENKRQREEAI